MRPKMMTMAMSMTSWSPSNVVLPCAPLRCRPSPQSAVRSWISFLRFSCCELFHFISIFFFCFSSIHITRYTSVWSSNLSVGGVDTPTGGIWCALNAALRLAEEEEAFACFTLIFGMPSSTFLSTEIISISFAFQEFSEWHSVQWIWIHYSWRFSQTETCEARSRAQANPPQPADAQLCWQAPQRQLNWQSEWDGVRGWGAGCGGLVWFRWHYWAEEELCLLLFSWYAGEAQCGQQFKKLWPSASWPTYCTT